MLIIDERELSKIRTSEIATRVRKSAPSWAKIATQKDWENGFVSADLNLPHRQGICETLEGPKNFEVGQMICRGVKGEFWPMKSEDFNKVKVLAPEYPVDEYGFATYFNTNTVWAVKINEDFIITAGGHAGEPLSQKAGAYLIFNDEGGCWPLEESLYPATYTPV